MIIKYASITSVHIKRDVRLEIAVHVPLASLQCNINSILVCKMIINIITICLFYYLPAQNINTYSGSFY